MRNEEEIFDVIKNSSDMKPREEFIHQTKLNLIKEARRYNKKHKAIKLSYCLSGIVAALVMVAWISFFGGTQYIADSVSQVTASLTKANKETSPIAENKKESTPISNDNPSVFIYHTHNTESFTPLLNIKNDPMNAVVDDKKNITLVGKKLDEFLQEKNIQSLHNKSDIQKITKSKGLNFSKSYEITREIIKDVLNKNKNLKLILDIHRDSRERHQSTIEINGESVSRITFVVSHLSSKYEENRYIAELFHNKLEEKYPGISSGIRTMGKETNNTYNQDLFGNSLLVEIGGVENTLEEEYRSTEILSEIINDVLDETEETLQEENIKISVFREESEQIEDVPLERYVMGVVATQMDPTFEMEALKAQALIARTYIIKHILHLREMALTEGAPLIEGAIVTDTKTHQVYKNQEELKKMWGADYNIYMERVKEAVLSTQGKILTFNNNPIDAPFFSTSNGFTENAEDYWGTDVQAPYLRSVNSSWDQLSPRFSSTKVISLNEFEDTLGIVLPEEGSIGVISERTEGGRVAKVVVDGKEFSGREIREKLELESSDFQWQRQGEQITIETKGRGHGVGMSQDGANGMALEGKDYKEIVNHFYNGIEIEKLNTFLPQILSLIEE
ncbi:MAG: stage II sporulation protein D [Bacillota bacterium]